MTSHDSASHSLPSFSDPIPSHPPHSSACRCSIHAHINIINDTTYTPRHAYDIVYEAATWTTLPSDRSTYQRPAYNGHTACTRARNRITSHDMTHKLCDMTANTYRHRHCMYFAHRTHAWTHTHIRAIQDAVLTFSHRFLTEHLIEGRM